MTNQEYEKKLQELQTEIDELKANKPTEYKRWRAGEGSLILFKNKNKSGYCIAHIATKDTLKESES